MRGRLGRIAGAVVCAGWVGVLVWASRVILRARDTSPEHLLGWLPIVYLAAWGPYLLCSRLGPVARGARFGACTASVLAAVGVFELPAALGFVDYLDAFATPTPPWRRWGNVADAELIYARKGHRGARLRFRGADVNLMSGVTPSTVYDCDLRLDAHGFRNPADLATADVVLVGDSFVEGLQVAASDLVSARLGERTGRTVANLGRTGYGPQQELHVLRRFGLPLKPQTCVWFFYEGNDLQDADSYDAGRAAARHVVRGGGSEDLYARSFTRNALALAVRRWLRPEPTRPARLYTGRTVDGTGRPAEIVFSCGVHEGVDLPAVPRGESPALEKVRDVLGEAEALCAGQGIDLVVVFVPTKFRVYGPRCSFAPESPCRSWRVDDLPRALGEAVRTVSDRIGFLDLTPRLQDESCRRPLLYLPDDTHWSAEGHGVVAEAVAKRLNRFSPSVR
jgi:lysophospholipase L1-like esterase